jgi:hypothetical protein
MEFLSQYDLAILAVGESLSKSTLENQLPTGLVKLLLEEDHGWSRFLSVQFVNDLLLLLVN